MPHPRRRPLQVSSRGFLPRVCGCVSHRLAFRLVCTGPSAESAMLISSLRDVIRTQAQELDTLQAKLKELSTSSASQVRQMRSSPLSLGPRLVSILTTLLTHNLIPMHHR
jgi:hypothetical protein